MTRWHESQLRTNSRLRWIQVGAALAALMHLQVSYAQDQVTIGQLEGKLRIEVNDELFTEYLYRDYAKPVFFPVLGPSGIPMTRNYPMVPGVAGEAEDHPHQKSLWFTHGNVNEIDFWGEGPQCGRVVHQRILHLEDGATPATLATENHWVGPSGKLICTDTREYWFGSQEESRFIDVRVTLHASRGELVFKDTKEGTFGVRTHPNLRLDREGEEFAHLTGTAVNSANDRDHDLWGKRAEWVDYRGKIDGQLVGLAIFDHPTNPRHPTWWHARNYGLVAANPFGIHDFENTPDEPTRGDFKIAAGQSATFLYRVLLHRGSTNVEQQYAEFANHRVKSTQAPSTVPADSRLAPPKDFNGYFPMAAPKSLADWQLRADRLRRQIQVAAGLWPMPPRDSVQATVHGRVERADYSVEKVYFESRPGFFVTGNLYRPKGFSGKRPAVLCPHGHWEGGRFQDIDLKEVRDQIANGGERFESAGRHIIQARCVQLARIGCIAFAYDMIGYADSQQIPFEVAHTLYDYRAEMDGRENWGLFSTQAELNLISVFGLQTFNSIRALDWLSELPEVDPHRIAITGASGGGTQSMILSAIDSRIAVSFPAVMVSTSMQGGCTCENACPLRVDAGNIDIAGLFAPKPLGLTTADDMTRDLLTKGYPELTRLYRLFEAEDHLFVANLVHFPHNYNHVSRAAMYRWINQHFALGQQPPILERDFKPLNQTEMSVWNEEHATPAGGVQFERDLCQQIARDSETLTAHLVPRDDNSFAQYQDIVGGAFKLLLNSTYPRDVTLSFHQLAQSSRDSHVITTGILANSASGTSVPIVVHTPARANGHVAIFLSGGGARSLVKNDGVLVPEIQAMVSEGVTAILADLFLQKGIAKDVHEPLISRKVPNPRDYAGFTFGYNDTLFAQRVSDILSIVTYAHDLASQRAIQAVHVIGLRGVGPHVAAARAIAGGDIDTVAIDTDGFRFADVASWRDRDFLPGAVKYGDLPALLALGAPFPIWITGEGGAAPELVRAAYDANQAEHEIHSSGACPASVLTSATDWLMNRIGQQE
ncbi:PmoA family protein, partial [Pirellulales bacterium]|nr:PmoA family protein [Pirellulales bacterium]